MYLSCLISALAVIFFSVSIECFAISVGEQYGGGTVFCVSDTPDTTQCKTVGSGSCGLIMSNKDLINYDSNPDHGVTWSNEYSRIGKIGESKNNGATNTAAIIKEYSTNNSSNNAAWACHNYRDPKEQHDDWFLPSIDELNKMYTYAKENNLIGRDCSGRKDEGAQCFIGGYDNDMYYWSSSCYSFFYAWDQAFSNGVRNGHSKPYIYFGVRAVRYFNNYNYVAKHKFCSLI